MDVTTDEDDVQRVFEGAVVFVQATLPQQASSVSQPLALKLYGLYKQATEGDIQSSGPGFFSLDFKSKSKWCASFTGVHGTLHQPSHWSRSSSQRITRSVPARLRGEERLEARHFDLGPLLNCKEWFLK